MTIRKKTMLGFALMAVIGIALGIFGLVATNVFTRMSEEMATLQNEYIGVGDVLNAHFIWRQGLTEAVMTGSEFKGSLDPDSCALGKWRNSVEAKNIKDPEILAFLRRIDEPHTFIHHEAEDIVAFVNSGFYDEAEEHLIQIVLPKTQEVISLLTDMEARYIYLIGEKSVEIESTESMINTAILVIIIVAVIACILLTWLVTSNIVKPLVPLAAFMNKASSTGDIVLRQEDMDVITRVSRIKDEIGQSIVACTAFVKRIIDVGEIMSKVAEGDLSVDIEVLSDADQMGKALKNMIRNLNLMFSEINTASSQVTAGASQVANSSQTMAHGSTEQAASIHQLSVSVNEITDKTMSSANMADGAATKSVHIREKAELGNEHMQNLVEAVTEISEAGQSINKIIKVIDDIAFQTNILALNAAVEAARAGQHGKGFAVVAEEVRTLASKSAEAARDTASMIENTIEKSNLGLSIATDTAASLKEIIEEIEQNVEMAQNIALISEEQKGAISQINIGIDQVSQVIQQNSATAEESAATSEELSGQATSLQSLIGRFKLKDADNQLPTIHASRSPARMIAMANTEAYSIDSDVNNFGKY